jgi:hypothetical protein
MILVGIYEPLNLSYRYLMKEIIPGYLPEKISVEICKNSLREAQTATNLTERIMGEIPRRGIFVEENFQRGIFGGELSEGNLRRGESSRREIFVEGNLRGGVFSEVNLRRGMFVGGKVRRFIRLR